MEDVRVLVHPMYHVMAQCLDETVWEGFKFLNLFTPLEVHSSKRCLLLELGYFALSQQFMQQNCFYKATFVPPSASVLCFSYSEFILWQEEFLFSVVIFCKQLDHTKRIVCLKRLDKMQYI